MEITAMKNDEKDKILKDVEGIINKACNILNHNYKIIKEVTSDKLINEIVVKNLSLYTSYYNDRRAKILKAEILDFWKTQTSFKLISQNTLLNKFSDIWHKLKSSGFKFKIDDVIFKLILASVGRGYISEIKVIELCHLNDQTKTFEYDINEVEKYVNSRLPKTEKQTKKTQNNDKKEEIKK